MNDKMINIINTVIESASEKTNISYYSQIKSWIAANSDFEDIKTLKLIANVVFYHLDLSTPKTPFRIKATFIDGRSASPNDLDLNDIKILENIYEIINDCELKARIADVLWSVNKSYNHAKDSIDFYLDSARRLEDLSNWWECFERIQRAHQITLLLGNNKEHTEKVYLYIIELLEKIDTSVITNFPGRLMELLQEGKYSDSEKYVLLTLKYIEICREQKDYNSERYYLDVLSKWYKLRNQIDEYRHSIIEIAKSHEIEVLEIINSDGDSSYILIVHLIEKAIRLYRKVPGMQEEIKRLLDDLSIYKLKVKENLQSFSHEVNVKEFVDNILDKFSGIPFVEALIKLSYIQNIPNKDSIKKELIESFEKYPITFLVTQDILDNKGRRIVRMPLFDLDDEISLEAYMLKEVVNNHIITGQIIIKNIINLIKREHAILEKDLEIIVDDNLFIPIDRKNLYLKGLYAGINGNFMEAIHILIPQLENSLREFAMLCGDVVVTFEDDGKEQVKPLNSILDSGNFCESFEVDWIFNLRSLLTEKYGSNMRNRIAHGLISDDEIQSPIAAYLWWISLRLCCMYSIGINEYIDKNADKFNCSN
ncbi:MAG: DUF4209 domain-containing protein [Firmicutes bacterium]|nr:DUF4209 domain-containing protein [Bacillota bacterium]